MRRAPTSAVDAWNMEDGSPFADVKIELISKKKGKGLISRRDVSAGSVGSLL